MLKKNSKLNEGFTLIETIIYIGIFGFIMSTALISIYTIFSTNTRNDTKVMVQEEGSFLLSKVDWVLSGTKNILLPTTNGDELNILKFDGSSIRVKLDGTDLVIDRGLGENILNNSNIEIICDPAGCFIHESASADGINPESLEAKFTVKSITSDGAPFSQEFSTIKYLRK